MSKAPRSALFMPSLSVRTEASQVNSMSFGYVLFVAVRRTAPAGLAMRPQSAESLLVTLGPPHRRRVFRRIGAPSTRLLFSHACANTVSATSSSCTSLDPLPTDIVGAAPRASNCPPAWPTELFVAARRTASGRVRRGPRQPPFRFPSLIRYRCPLVAVRRTASERVRRGPRPPPFRFPCLIRYRGPLHN